MPSLWCRVAIDSHPRCCWSPLRWPLRTCRNALVPLPLERLPPRPRPWPPPSGPGRAHGARPNPRGLQALRTPPAQGIRCPSPHGMPARISWRISWRIWRIRPATSVPQRRPISHLRLRSRDLRQHGLPSNTMALITSDCDAMRVHEHRMALITSECVPVTGELRHRPEGGVQSPGP